MLYPPPPPPSAHTCTAVQAYLTKLGGGKEFRGKVEKGKENPFSCCVLAGMRSMQEREESLRVRGCRHWTPRASCLVPRASCLVPRASCLLPPASCLVTVPRDLGELRSLRSVFVVRDVSVPLRVTAVV